MPHVIHCDGKINTIRLDSTSLVLRLYELSTCISTCAPIFMRPSRTVFYIAYNLTTPIYTLTPAALNIIDNVCRRSRSRSIFSLLYSKGVPPIVYIWRCQKIAQLLGLFLVNYCMFTHMVLIE